MNQAVSRFCGGLDHELSAVGRGLLDVVCHGLVGTIARSRHVVLVALARLNRYYLDPSRKLGFPAVCESRAKENDQ